MSLDGKTPGGLNLAFVLGPVLDCFGRDARTLADAVVVVAEEMAAGGVLILGPDGRPARGVTDERAVVGALACYAKALVRHGHLDDAMDVVELIDRVDRLGNRPRPLPTR